MTFSAGSWKPKRKIKPAAETDLRLFLTGAGDYVEESAGPVPKRQKPGIAVGQLPKHNEMGVAPSFAQI
jgi:hypothetical protein